MRLFFFLIQFLDSRVKMKGERIATESFQILNLTISLSSHIMYLICAARGRKSELKRTRANYCSVYQMLFLLFLLSLLDFKNPIYISFDWLSALTSCRSSCFCDPFFPCGFPSIVKVLADNSFVFRGDSLIFCVCPVWHRTRPFFFFCEQSQVTGTVFSMIVFSNFCISNFLDLFCQFCSVTISVHPSSAFSESC